MATTPTRAGSASCEMLAGLRVDAGPAGGQQVAATAVDSPEQCTATHCSYCSIVTDSVISVQKDGSLEQSGLYGHMEQVPGVSVEISESESENVSVLATQQFTHCKSSLTDANPSAGALGQPIPRLPLPTTSLVTGPTAEVPSRVALTSSLEQLTAAAIARPPPTPTVQAAEAACFEGTLAGDGAAVAAARDTSKPAIKKSRYTARAAADGEGLKLAAAGSTAVVSAVGEDLQSRCDVKSPYNQCLREAYRETCDSATVSTTEHTQQDSVQPTSQNTLACGSRSARNSRRGVKGDAPNRASRRRKTRRAAATTGGAAVSSAFSSSVPPMCALPADVSASRAPTPAAGSACPSPPPSAAALAPVTGDLASGAAGHLATRETDDCTTTERACATQIPLQQYMQRQQHPQHIGDWNLVRQFPLQAPRQLVQRPHPEQQQQPPPVQPPAQPAVVQWWDQKHQREQTLRGQELQGQQLYIRQQQQLQQPRRSQQASQHKPIGLFLLEDYDGPELPPGYPLVSLSFGTSSEEEEEDPHQHHGCASAGRRFSSHGAAGETRLGASSLVRCAVLKKKKKRERKVSVGAIDALWQPHFHPHNQEFRVRYRYKGSMRLKTLSCARFGREGARRLTVAFVQRWQKSGRRIAAKTHRSKLALSDLPSDIHGLPVYDKKRRGDSSMKRNDTTVNSSYCSGSDKNSCVPNCRTDSSESKNIRTSQDRCSSSDHTISSIRENSDHCQKVEMPAAQVLPLPSVATATMMPAHPSLNNRPGPPLFAIPRQTSPLGVLPSVTTVASAPSTVFAPAAGTVAPAAAHPCIPSSAAAFVNCRRARCWSKASSPATGAGAERGKEGVGALLTQRTLPTDKSNRDRATTMSSSETSHVLSSQPENRGDSSPFLLTTTTSNRDTSSTSPATFFSRERNSNTHSCSGRIQTARPGDSCHLLPVHGGYSDYCYVASSTGPMSSICHICNQQSNASRSNFQVEREAVDSAAGSGAAAAATSGDALELRDAFDGEKSAEKAACHTRPCAQDATATCLLPFHNLGSAADCLHTPPSPGSASAFLAPPETLVTSFLPALSTQLSPAAAASAATGVAASTTGATPAADGDAHSACPAIRAANAEPATRDAARQLRVSSNRLPAINVESTPATNTATCGPSAWVLPPGVLLAGLAAYKANAATLAYEPVSSNTELNHFSSCAPATFPDVTATMESASDDGGTSDAGATPPLAACARQASAATAAPASAAAPSDAVPVEPGPLQA